MTRSVSRVWRLPLPYPPCRRFSSTLMNSASRTIPEGNPSTMAVRAGPCDSPAVRERGILLSKEGLAREGLVNINVFFARAGPDLRGEGGRVSPLFPPPPVPPAAGQFLF